MRSWRCWRQLLGRWLLAASLTGGAGCLSCLHPFEPPRPEHLESCHILPKCGRNHVYVFLMNGIDPLNCGNLTGLRDYLQALGFIKTYYGYPYHAGWFKSEILRLYQEDADARFVLVGFRYGANVACALAQDVMSDHLTIDLVVYLEGNMLGNVPALGPEHVGRVIHILPNGCLCKGADLEGAENIRLNDGGSFGSASHPHTLDVLADELARVAATVPVTIPDESNMPPAPETAPTPRPVKPQKSAVHDEWDFLKPVASLGNRPSMLRYHTDAARVTASSGGDKPNAVKGHSVLKPNDGSKPTD